MPTIIICPMSFSLPVHDGISQPNIQLGCWGEGCSLPVGAAGTYGQGLRRAYFCLIALPASLPTCPPFGHPWEPGWVSTLGPPGPQELNHYLTLLKTAVSCLNLGVERGTLAGTPFTQALDTENIQSLCGVPPPTARQPWLICPLLAKQDRGLGT